MKVADRHLPVVDNIDQTLRLMELVAKARDPFAAFKDLLLEMRHEITEANR